MFAQRYTRVRPERNEFRFYLLFVAPTLWGTYAVVRRDGVTVMRCPRSGQRANGTPSGRLGAAPRRERVVEFATPAEAQAALDAQIARREKRGYTLSDPERNAAV